MQRCEMNTFKRQPGQGLGFAAEDYDFFADWFWDSGGGGGGGNSWWDFGGGGGTGPYGWGDGGYDPMGPDYFTGGDDGVGTGPSDAWWDSFYGWLEAGLDPESAAQFADEDVGEVFINIGSESCLERWSPGCEYTMLPYSADLPSPWDILLTPGIAPEFFPFDWGDYGALPGTSQKLPGACYGPTYHPYPIGHPQQDLCMPYPTNPAARKRAQQQEQKRQQQAQQQAKAQQKAQQQQKCPQGQWPNPQTKRCEPIPKCAPPGTVFHQKTGRCLTPAQIAEAAKASGKSNWWLWLLLAGVGVVALSGDRSSGSGRRR